MYTAPLALFLRTASMLLVATACAAQAHPKDVKGASDHPLFTNRMPGYYISNYRQQEFAAFQVWHSATHRSRRQVHPNQLLPGRPGQASWRVGCAPELPGRDQGRGRGVVFSNANYSVMKVTRDGVETWVQVQAGTNRYLYMNIVERTQMAQVITADAMATALDRDGFIGSTSTSTPARLTFCRSRCR